MRNAVDLVARRVAATAGQYTRRARYAARAVSGRVPVGEEETAFRLAILASSATRSSADRIRLPFGEIEYVDAESLRWQYEEIFRRGEYDLVDESSVRYVLDCGANIGLSAIRFATLYPGARIVAFEADPTIAAMLRRNLEACAMTAVEVHPVAVAGADGEMTFATGLADAGHLSPAGAVRVPALRLSTFVDQEVDLLKLDIEGAEYDVLRELADAGCLSRVRNIACELHIRDGDAPRAAAALALLSHHGFSWSTPYARTAPDLPGAPIRTPFAAVPDCRALLRIVAWRTLDE